MYTIAKRFHFSAGHHLPGLPNRPDGSEHPCSRPHGHNYEVELILCTSTTRGLNEHGFVVDYGDLAPFKQYIDEKLDHRDLNEVLDVPTTAENIAKHLYDVAWKMWHDVAITVRVSETPSTWAEFTES